MAYFFIPEMKTKLTTYYSLLLFVAGTGCQQSANTLFKNIPSSHTGIGFENKINEDIDFNILTYEYLYNGGGVATGDINNDGLTDIVFSGNMVNSRLYLNRGNLAFEDITEKSAFTDRIKWKTGVVMSDVNGDGLLDIYLCYSGPGTDESRSNQLFINQGIKDGIPVFVEKAKEYKLDAPGTYSTTASFFDIDNDGDLDMFLVNHADMFYNPFYNTEKLRAKRHPKFGNRLYRNDGNHFSDISEQANISGSGLNFGLSVSTSDINKDGWTDIYVTNDYDERDFLYLNNHNGTFTEVLNKAAGHISEFAMGSDIADYNNDLKTDVMVLDMLPEDNHRQKLLKGADTYDKYSTRVQHGFHHQQMRNTLQLNNFIDNSGMPVFSEVGQLAGISKTDWSWAPLFADFDNDGWKDLFISNGIFKDITNLDFVKYTSGYSNNFTNQKGDKVAMWELIKDMPSTKLNNYFYRNNHDLTFTDVSKTWGSGNEKISNGSAYADLDNDGDLDLVINCLNDPVFILKNQTSENTHAHFLKIKLQGEKLNSLGIGAKITVTTLSGTQLYEQYISRGFQSSVDPIIHFGLGSDSIVNTLKVEWPSGKISDVQNIKADSTLIIAESNGVFHEPGKPDSTTAIFYDITRSSGIQYNHKQSGFVDFKVSPLLPYQLSKIGPCLAKEDVNNDGLEDLFIGSTTKQQNILYLQSANGTFKPSPIQPWNNTKDKTFADALFFDADKDGDADLYLVSGGVDFPLNAENYQDELYSNDGKGNFQYQINAIPKETLSGSCVRAADYNNDGLQDLFIGSKYTPGQFPAPSKSIFLINKSKGGEIKFENDIQKDSSVLQPGMVSDAVWIDLKKDQFPELVVAGLFMPITIIENEKGALKNKTKEYGLDDTQGWWCRIKAGDLNNDGNIDLVVGNLGTNSQFRASEKEPLQVTYADFNDDKVLDPVITMYMQGKSYPYFTRDEMLDQVPSLQKKFRRYTDYSDAQLEDLFPPEKLQKAPVAKIKTFNSSVLINNGKGQFNVSSLPVLAQQSIASALDIIDVDKDGNKDILVAGNCYPMRVQLGPLDASFGIVLKGNGKGNFSTINYEHTGLYIPGDVRSMLKMQSKDHELIIVAKCNDPVQVVAINNEK